MTRPSADDFKKLPLFMRFKQNCSNRNWPVTHLLSSIMSIPLLLILGAMDAVYWHLNTKSQKNSLFYLLLVPILFPIFSLTLVAVSVRFLLTPIMFFPAVFVNWGVSFIQACRGKQTISANVCEKIAGNIMNDTGRIKDDDIIIDDEFRPESLLSFRSLVYICHHPVHSWKIWRINRTDPKSLKYVRELIDDEFAVKKEELNHAIEKKKASVAPLTGEWLTLSQNMQNLINDREVSDRKYLEFSLMPEMNMTISTKALRGISIKTMKAAIATKESTLTVSAVDAFMLLLNEILSSNASKTLSDQVVIDAIDAIDAAFHTIQWGYIGHRNLPSLYISGLNFESHIAKRRYGMMYQLIASCIAMKTPFSTNLATILLNSIDGHFWQEFSYTINGQTVEKFNFLHCAALHGNLTIVRFLINQTIDHVISDTKGSVVRMPFHEKKDSSGKIPLDYMPEGPEAAGLKILLSPLSSPVIVSPSSTPPPLMITSSDVVITAPVPSLRDASSLKIDRVA